MIERPVKIGVVGCGTISETYLRQCKNFGFLEVTACADLDGDRARSRAAEFGIPKACDVAEILADPEIEIILNLTVPKAHAAVGLAALESGKHLYTEKPLAITREEARLMLERAETKGLRIGCAPDTFLGGGLQTCRKLIDDGWIGQPLAATAFKMGLKRGLGPERWHPDPEFYYQVGGGPMFDMGPYYLTALLALLGPVSQVTGSTTISYPERLITSQPKYGTRIKVETATHIVGIIHFVSHVIGTIITSFDIQASELPNLEIYGTAGTLSLPDPNGFGGPVRIKRDGAAGWSEVPLAYGYTENNRGIGLADMAAALRSGRPHRADGRLAYHVLDVMHAFEEASREGKRVTLSSTCIRPEPLPLQVPETIFSHSG